MQGHANPNQPQQVEFKCITPDSKQITLTDSKDQVWIRVGNHIMVSVPAEFTVEGRIAEQVVPMLISYPVKDSGSFWRSYSNRYDARLLLSGADNRTRGELPGYLEFDQECYQRKEQFFSNVETALRNRGYTSRDFEIVSLQSDQAQYASFRDKKEEEANFIKTQAHFYDIEIKHDNPGNLPSIAMTKDPKFGPVHCLGLRSAFIGTSVYQGLVPLYYLAFSMPLSVSLIDYYALGIVGLSLARALHPRPAPDRRTRCTSMNHFSVPTFLLYTGGAVATFAGNFELTGYVISSAGLASSGGITATAMAIPLGVALTGYGIFRYGPRVASRVKDCVAGIGTCLSNFSIWKRNQARADAVEAKTDLSASLLPNPGQP